MKVRVNEVTSESILTEMLNQYPGSSAIMKDDTYLGVPEDEDNVYFQVASKSPYSKLTPAIESKELKTLKMIADKVLNPSIPRTVSVFLDKLGTSTTHIIRSINVSLDGGTI